MPAVIFLHNTLTSKAMWDGVVQRLPGIDAHALDFRAHGAHQAEAGPFTAADLVRDVVIYADARGLRHFCVVGSSIGATVALMLARACPERVQALVLTGLDARSASSHERVTTTLTAALLARTGPFPYFAREAVRRLFAPTSLPQPFWLDHLRTLAPRAIGAALRCWRDRPDLQASLAGIATPTLVIMGADDHACPAERAQAQAKALVNARFETVAYAAHMAPWEQPERFAHLSADFLQHHGARAVDDRGA